MNRSLKWLAKNMDEWDPEYAYAFVVTDGAGVPQTVRFNNTAGFTEVEWRAARAERNLQKQVDALISPGASSNEEEEEAWAEAEKRMDIVGTNGNDGLHYSQGKQPRYQDGASIAERYPQYYKSVRHLEHVDVYQLHQLFGIEDWSGCIQHASKKLLLSGARTGGKPKRKDIEEARDTLTRWLEIQDGHLEVERGR